MTATVGEIPFRAPAFEILDTGPAYIGPSAHIGRRAELAHAPEPAQPSFGGTNQRRRAGPVMLVVRQHALRKISPGLNPSEIVA